MRPVLAAAVALLAVALVLLAVACSGTGKPVVDSLGAGLQGPAGLSASVDATGLEHLSGLAVDGQGRLWATTAASKDEGKDGLYVVPAAGAAAVEVVTDLHTPMGVLWIGDTLFVSSIGRVDAFRGFDGTAFADVHQVLQLPDGVGMSAGLVLGSDGRLRLGISASCDACTPTSDYDGSVVSFLPDGTDLRIEASGIRAPIGLAYDPGTDDLFVTMNQRDDLGDQTPGDWLSIVRAGQHWGFPSCYGQGGAECASTPAPVASLDPHAAVSGVAIVTGQLGATVGHAAIVAEWATGKVLRVTLDRQGGTTTGTVQPFLTGIAKPVAVTLGSDGSLLVGDWATGTVFRITTSAAAATAPATTR